MMTKINCFNFMGHTTGAWTVERRRSITGDANTRMIQAQDHNTFVAKVYGVNEEQAEINAQLIAKAPELCERLERVESVLESIVGGDWAGHESYESGLVDKFWCGHCHTKWEWLYNADTARYALDPWHTAKCKIAIGKQLLGLPVNIREEG